MSISAYSVNWTVARRNFHCLSCPVQSVVYLTQKIYLTAYDHFPALLLSVYTNFFSVIGLVVGSLSIANYLSVLERMKELCKKSKKSYYILSVGKLNVPKLSNFAEIDLFVLLTCPYNIIIDWSDYYRPIVTPFEFEIAYDRSKFWMAGLGWTPEICLQGSFKKKIKKSH